MGYKDSAMFGEAEGKVKEGICNILYTEQTVGHKSREASIGLVRLAFEDALRDALGYCDRKLAESPAPEKAKETPPPVKPEEKKGWPSRK